MPEELHPFFHSGLKLVVLLLLLSGATYFVGIGSTDLWAPDEPRYTEVAREMMERGDCIVPHLDGQPYPHKPPMFFWLVAATTKIVGGEVTNVTARIPSAVMGVACVLLTYLIGKLLWNRGTGFLAACALATSALVIYLSRRGSMDTTLGAFCTLALYAFAKNSFAERPTLRWDITFFASLALAALTKGPEAAAPVGTAVFFWIVAGVKRRVTGKWVLSKLLCLALFLGIGLAWLLPACRRGGPEYTRYLLHQTVDRYEDPQAGGRGEHHTPHHHPVWYYFQNFPWCFLPWTLPFLVACWHLVVSTKKEDRRPVVFVFIWFVWVFAMFSSSSSKREVYLVPLMPAAALIVGKLIADTAFRPPTLPPLKRLTLPFGVTAGLFVLVGAGLVYAGIAGRSLIDRWYGDIVGVMDVYDKVRVPVTWIGAGLAAGWGMCLLAQWNRRGGVAFAVSLLTLVACVDAASVYVMPAVDPYKSARGLATRLAERMGPKDEVAEFSLAEEGFLFYLHRPIRSFETKEVDRLVSFLAEGGTKYLLVAEDEYEKKLAGRKDLHLDPADSQEVGHRRLLVLRAVR